MNEQCSFEDMTTLWNDYSRLLPYVTVLLCFCVSWKSQLGVMQARAKKPSPLVFVYKSLRNAAFSWWETPKVWNTVKFWLQEKAAVWKPWVESQQANNCQVKDTHTGFTYVLLRDTASVIRNQWGDRIHNFKVFYLLQDCYIYRGPIRLLRKIRVEVFFERGSLAYCSEWCTSISVFLQEGWVIASLLISASYTYWIF
jgi:hypothetical protein